MDYEQLKHYGELPTAKASPQLLLASFAKIPKDLGIIGTPKFLAKLQSKDRYWKRKRFRTAEEAGLTHEQFMEGIRYTLAFYTAIEAACGREKALKTCPRFLVDLGVMVYDEFFPQAKDFRDCSDLWQAIRGYFRGLFDAYSREKAMNFEIVRDTEDDLQFRVTQCRVESMYREAGYPHLATVGGDCEVTFLGKLMAELGGAFTRDAWLCRGDAYCDWHFCRTSVSP